MLLELRRYSVNSIDAMHERMRDVLLPLFEKHGIPRPLAIWEPHSAADKPILTWMLRWTSFEHRLAAWAHFAPFWSEAKQARGGTEFVTRTDLSVIAPWPGQDLPLAKVPDSCESLWIVQPPVGHGATFRALCVERLFERFVSAGARSIAAFDYVFGPLPQTAVLLTWSDFAERERGYGIVQRALAEFLQPGLPTPPALTDLGSWEFLNRAPYASFI